MRTERIPELNRYGLVLSPTKEELVELRKSRTKPFIGYDETNRHHLYWPKVKYNKSTRALSQHFREHRFNSIWILMSDHGNYHDRYDGVPVPSREVMREFLYQADFLDQLGVCVSAIKDINQGIMLGKKTHTAKTDRQKEEKLIEVLDRVERAEEFELVPEVLTLRAIKKAMNLPDIIELAA
jgi:hypothetical protein